MLGSSMRGKHSSSRKLSCFCTMPFESNPLLFTPPSGSLYDESIGIMCIVGEENHCKLRRPRVLAVVLLIQL